jgi:hypothetical protein
MNVGLGPGGAIFLAVDKDPQVPDLIAALRSLAACNRRRCGTGLFQETLTVVDTLVKLSKQFDLGPAAHIAQCVATVPVSNPVWNNVAVTKVLTLSVGPERGASRSRKPCAAGCLWQSKLSNRGCQRADIEAGARGATDVASSLQPSRAGII